MKGRVLRFYKRGNEIPTDVAAQLDSTFDMAALLQYAGRDCGQTHSELTALLEEISREFRMTAREFSRRPRAVASRRQDHDDSLEPLLNALCTYSRETSQRLAELTGSADSQSIECLRKLLRVANRGIVLIDLYRNAIAVRSPLSKLPCWKSVTPANARFRF